MVSSYRPAVTSDCVIDVSHWNSAVDFHAVKAAGIRAVFIKATQGAHPQGRDPLYHHNAVAAEAAGLLWAPYHFMTHEPAQAQFDEIVNELGRLMPGTVFMIDWEGDHIPADIVAELGQMIEDETGRAPLLYCGRWQLSHPHPILSKWPLNLPEYGTHPICPPGWDAWMFHQYTQTGVVAGVHGHVDRSVFAGTVEELEAWWTGKPAAAAQVPKAKAAPKPEPVAAADPVVVEPVHETASADAVSPVTDESHLEHVLLDALAIVEKVI